MRALLRPLLHSANKSAPDSIREAYRDIFHFRISSALRMRFHLLIRNVRVTIGISRTRELIARNASSRPNRFVIVHPRPLSSTAPRGRALIDMPEVIATRTRLFQFQPDTTFSPLDQFVKLFLRLKISIYVFIQPTLFRSTRNQAKIKRSVEN